MSILSKLKNTNLIITVILASVVILVIVLRLKREDIKCDIDAIILKSGDNRKELIKVLKYYRKNDDKYKAACYLISNLEHHKSAVKTNFLNNNHNLALDTLDKIANIHVDLGVDVKRQTKDVWKTIKSTKLYLDSLKKEIKTEKSHAPIYDTKNLTSSWLIAHIEDAFLNWENSKLLDDTNFDEFKETLLPYRYGEEELNVSQDYINNLKTGLLRDVDLSNTGEVIDKLNLYFGKIKRFTTTKIFSSDLGFYNILNWENISCNQQTIIANTLLNRLGIPTYIDYTPVFVHRDQGHSWCVSKDSTGKYLPFSPWWQSLRVSKKEGEYRKNYFKRTSKVYRKTFASQPESAINFKNVDEKVHPFFNKTNYIDVTDEYHDTSSITIDLEDFDAESRNLVYLSVFTVRGWCPVACGVVTRDNKVTFEKVPKGITYIIGDYNGKRIRQVKSAFYVNKEGKVIEFAANFDKRRRAIAFRKYPDKERLLDKRKKLIGSRFQASNTRQFEGHVEDLFSFDYVPKNYVENIDLKNEKKFRYVRFITRDTSEISLSILEFYSKQSEKPIYNNKETLPYVLSPRKTSLERSKKNKLLKLNGEIISNKANANKNRLKLAFDGNMETFTRKFRWIGLDFGKPQKITNIRYAARNANNRINIGDTYQLLFYDKKWKVLATQKARYNFLVFKNVPSGTMYWLRNKTKGKEELPFVYYKDKQLFVNYDDIESFFN